jgi:hypothetical protein
LHIHLEVLAMRRWLKWGGVPVAAATMALLGMTPVLADGDCHPFDNTTRVKHGPEKGALLLTSDLSQSVPDGGIDVSVPAGLHFSDLTQLQTDYQMTQSTCHTGSPRFQINVLAPGDTNPADTKNIFVYFGSVPTSGVDACPEATSEVNTGNYIGTAGPGDVPGRYDTSQLLAGTQISTYTATLALFGTWQVTGIQVVVDGGSAGVPQQALIDRLQVDGHLCLPDRHQDSP